MASEKNVQLIICEKPSVAAVMASALAEGNALKKTEGGTPYYELKRNGKEIIVVPAVGHVYSLKQKEGQKGYPVFEIEWVPSSEANKAAAFTKKYLNSLKLFLNKH